MGVRYGQARYCRRAWDSMESLDTFCNTSYSLPNRITSAPPYDVRNRATYAGHSHQRFQLAGRYSPTLLRLEADERCFSYWLRRSARSSTHRRTSKAVPYLVPIPSRTRGGVRSIGNQPCPALLRPSWQTCLTLPSGDRPAQRDIPTVSSPSHCSSRRDDRHFDSADTACSVNTAVRVRSYSPCNDRRSRSTG